MKASLEWTMTHPPCLRLCPANPGNPRNRIEGESPLQGKGHTACEADRKVDARSQAGTAPDENTDMREPANKSLLTDVSRLRSYRCTIIASTTSNELVERMGCGAT